MKVKRPNGVLYFIVYLLLYPLLKLMFRLEIDRRNYNPPKGPFLVVSNHSSFMDFLVVMLVFYPRRLNAVAAQKFFLYRPLNKLLPVMGCIPKNLFDPDVRAIKGIITVLRRGDRILLYPEGRCSTDGVYAGIHKSTGKLVKTLGAPVISCHIEGGYTCMPFWRKGIRLGRERVTLADLFSGEDIKKLSVDEINAAIDMRLSGIDTRPPDKLFRTFRSKRLAEGLQNIIYWCPKCGREFTLETKGNIIRCAACGNTAQMDRSARLISSPDSDIPENVHLWYKEQSRYEMRKLSADMEPVIEQVTVRMPAVKAGDGMIQCGAGTLRLTPKGWYYDGELSGETVSLFFPIDSVPAIPFDPDDNFQIYANGSFYMFTPEQTQKCAKYAVLGECVYWRFASKNQMTPGWDNGLIEQVQCESRQVN